MNVRSILERLHINVVEEVGEHLWALCPFHTDSKPSWRIRSRGSRAGLHYCFACTEGGDVAALVQHVRGYATKTAAHDWLDEHGEQVEREDLIAPSVTLSMRGQVVQRMFRMPLGFESGHLSTWPSQPQAYARSRGLTDEQVEWWGIGYACEGRLASRLVIPVVSYQRELSCYMARTWESDSKRKYLYPNGDERPDLDVMFGEVNWVPDTTCVVTEGALKSLAVERAMTYFHVSNAALGGSGIRPMHIARLVARKFSRIVVMTDVDPAGEKAGDSLEGALARYTRVIRVRLPQGKDADTVDKLFLRDTLAPYVG